MVQKTSSILFCFIFFSLNSYGEILFEGYSRIYFSNKPAGYTVSRYELDSKKNQFISTSYLKLKRGGEVSESTKAVSDMDFNPVSYTFMRIADKKVKTIDAQFKQQKMSLVINENGKTKKIEKQISKNAFLSTFLIYKILKSKEGLQEQSRYLYESLLEEEGLVRAGQVIVLKPQNVNGFEAFKVRNLIDMENEITEPPMSQKKAQKDPVYTEFVSFVNSQGHLLQLEAADIEMRVDLMATQKEATEGFAFDVETMKLLFGDVPLGEKNVVAQSKISKEKLQTTPEKQMGVDQGKGLLIKQIQPEKKSE
ncbi:MAG TPA: hypothetical protein PLJ21_06560 [Pseudobdellovibrionaceae bacterium]|nr:hypothetical protein [Pseudobdellovibrionaceae bacterium]